MQNYFDTICAIATPLSIGAVGIIRISGDNAFDIVQKIFSKKIENGKINHGWILKNNKKIDEVILLPFNAPKSFTGEDVIEIQTHGSPIVLNEILNLLLDNGAKMAERGEFSKRAFLNHKIDMTKAEAILDLIHAKTAKFAQSSAQNLSGVLKLEIDKIKNDIKNIFAKIVASIDFPEDVKEVEYSEIITVLDAAVENISNILKNAKMHNIMRDGVKIAILGNVNVGKSSLFNTLLNIDRAIVTDIAGTTRDIITESIDINGISATIIDTAGIRESADKVEQIGIQSAKNYVANSDLVLCLFDGSKGLNEADEAVFKEVPPNIPKIFIATKSDIKNYEKSGVVSISSKTKDGIKELKNLIFEKIVGTNQMETEFSTNLRQQECLKNAQKSLEIALVASKNNQLQDLISIDIKSALLALNEITGEVLTDNILNDIFDNFCIGK